nr:EOG090X0C0Q [Triops cancriformis]
MLGIPAAQNCTYTACFCEENVWQLCHKVDTEEPELGENCFAVFISNATRAIPLWKQKAGKDDDCLIIWDYHVIFVVKNADSSLVYDLDTTLTFPVPFLQYIDEAIRSEDDIQPQYHRFFRVISAKSYLQTFASDRSHMKKDDQWLAEPPSYPPIHTTENTHNLDCFIDMTAGTGYGDVLTLQDFVGRFSRT